jgi:hypothetical protein
MTASSKPVKFLICYVQRCSPQMKIAASQKEADKFCREFMKKHKDNKEDNWIDFMVETVSKVRTFNNVTEKFDD